MLKRLFALATMAVGAASFGPAMAEQGVTENTIEIGAFGPITGPAAYIGLAGRDGANMALKEINEAGGINGRQISLQFEDDGHSPAKALAAVKKLLDSDEVFALLSVAGSNSTVGTIDYVKEKGRVMYVSIASAPEVTWPFSKNLFRGGTTETPRYGELYAEFIVEQLQGQKVAIISGREEYPKNEGDALTDKLSEWYDLEPVVRLEFNIGDTDFTPQLLQVQSAGPDVIAFFGNPAEASIAMQQAKELGVDAPFFVGSNMVGETLLTAAGQAAEGVSGFSLVPLLPESSDPAMMEWKAKWEAEYPNLPEGRPNTFDLLGYADMHVLAEAMRRAGKDLTTEALIAALETIDGYRVGPVASYRTFTDKHHIGNLDLIPLQVENGEWKQLDWTSKRESNLLARYK